MSDKLKFFENAMEESQRPSPKPGKIYFLLSFTHVFQINFDVFLFLEKVFSYLSADEIEKMKAEEEKKIALNKSEGGSLNMLDHSDDEEFIEPPPARYLFVL